MLFGLFFFFVFIILRRVFCNKSYFGSSSSSFESGFDGRLLSQISVSVHFFLIIVLFVLFDLELVLFICFLLLDEGVFGIFYFFMFLVLASFYLEFWLNKILWVF